MHLKAKFIICRTLDKRVSGQPFELTLDEINLRVFHNVADEYLLEKILRSLVDQDLLRVNSIGAYRLSGKDYSFLEI